MQNMIFSEYALGLLPYISGKSSKGEYLTELIGLVEFRRKMLNIFILTET